jgi:hypothetical protein
MTEVPAAAPATVLALVPDLLFSSRIQETARRLGHPARVARSLDDLGRGLGEGPGLVVLDLTAASLDLEAALAVLGGMTPPVPVLGFTTHAAWKTTLPLHARCTRVVTRETLTRELPDLIRALVVPAPVNHEERS